VSNPVDEYFSVKEALFGLNPGTMGKLKGALSSAGVQVGVGVGVMAAPAVAQKVFNAVMKHHDYNKMMEHNPGLEDIRREDPKRFNNLYSSLRRMNPEFSRDPFVSGSYMGRLMVAGSEGAGGVLIDAARVRPGMALPTVGDAWRSASQSGSKAFGQSMDKAEDPFQEQAQRVKGMRLGIEENELRQKQQAFEDLQRQQRLFG
jgi:hypothetical protein